MRANQATAEVFFTAFKALKNKEREAFLEKVISDPELGEDLFDVALIERAKKVKGKVVSAKEYFTKRRKMESAASVLTMSSLCRRRRKTLIVIPASCF
ncbi:MAG: hypothetical protein AB1306_06995 [Nitrospirota bacterium]